MEKKVLVTGVFDILHEEHVKFLKKAKSVGDFLMVGVECDLRVRKMKGEGRPVNNEEIRVKNLQDLKIADQVFVLPEKFDKSEDHLQLVKKVGTDVLAVSSHTKFIEEKRRIMNQVGGEVMIVHQHNPGVSTSGILGEDK
jgi:cytidyltransferase-like protein